MGRPNSNNLSLSFRDILNLLKDKASLSKATLLHPSTALLLRATTHSPSTPPSDRHLSALLLFGHSPRATASPLISALIDRLHRTRNSIVALKCLLIIHHIINRGPFILQDQLSVFPASGGRNYLKLSSFRDTFDLPLSQWVRWYGRYLETSLSTRRILGYFITERGSQLLKISSCSNSDLIREIESVAMLIEEISKLPESAEGSLLVKEVMGLVIGDYAAAASEIGVRVGEVGERLGCLGFGEVVELVIVMNRLVSVREKVTSAMVEKPVIGVMWEKVEEVKKKVESVKMDGDGRKMMVVLGRRSGKVSESTRFDDRRVLELDSVVFHSGRF